jgi:DNA-binding MarR family transcriptional regulator
MEQESDDAREIWTALYMFFLEEHEQRLKHAGTLGVSPGDLKALIRLTPGSPQPMRALAETWRCDTSTVTWIVDRLESRGLVERKSDANDRRIKAIALSAEGERLRSDLLSRLYAPPSVLSDLPAIDLQVLRRLSDRLRNADGQGGVSLRPGTPTG